MSNVKNYMYYIEYNDGEKEVMDKTALAAQVDDIYDKVIKIVKKYRLHNDSKKKICMTLYTLDHTFSAEEYIQHYQGLSKQEYGSNFLSDFDIELITMFN